MNTPATAVSRERGDPGTQGVRVGDAMKSGQALLRDAGIPEAQLLVEWSMSSYLDCARLELPIHFRRVMSNDQINKFTGALERLASGEPLQYVLGHCEFMGRCFLVNPGCLIPRPETETLVELVLRADLSWNEPDTRIVDVGCGCGCIVITLACERPLITCSAVDTSPDAIGVAKRNAFELGVADRIEFAAGNLLSSFDHDSVNAIVANLPYIRTGDIGHLDKNVRDFEPHVALDGGMDGLALIRILVRQSHGVLRKKGRLFLEVGAGQADAVQREMLDAGFGDITVDRDLAGIGRVVSGVLFTEST